MRDVAEIERALETFGQSANGDLTGSALANNPSRLNYWAWALHKLPAVYYERLFVAAGGLLSYGADLTDQYHRAAAYVDSILKGAKPADLPVQEPVKFDLAINLKTAKALGIELPSTLLAQANNVIE